MYYKGTEVEKKPSIFALALDQPYVWISIVSLITSLYWKLLDVPPLPHLTPPMSLPIPS